MTLQLSPEEQALYDGVTTFVKDQYQESWRQSEQHALPCYTCSVKCAAAGMLYSLRW